MATPTPKKESASKGQETPTEPRTPLLLVTKAGKKVETSYDLFEASENIKENRLPRIMATKLANRVLKYGNAEEILKDELRKGFVKGPGMAVGRWWRPSASPPTRTPP